jgi:hypothetical protein
VFDNFGRPHYLAAKAGLVGLSNVSAIARIRARGGLPGPLVESLGPELVTPVVARIWRRTATSGARTDDVVPNPVAGELKGRLPLLNGD